MIEFEELIDSEMDLLRAEVDVHLETLELNMRKIVYKKMLEHSIYVIREMIDTLDSPEEVLADLERQLGIITPPLGFKPVPGDESPF